MPDLPKNRLEQTYTRREFLKLSGKVLVAGSVALIAFLRGGIAERLLYAQTPERKLDFSKYQPPADEGVTVESKFFDNNRKTVIWVADVHPYEQSGADNVQQSIDVQKQDLRIAEDLLGMGIKLPIVVENWRTDWSFEDYVTKVRGWDEKALLRFDHLQLLKLMEIADPEQRRAYANKHFVGRSKLLMPAMLKAMYPDKVEIVGTDTEEIAKEGLRIASKHTAVMRVIRKKEIPSCHHNGTGKNLSLVDMGQGYDVGEPTAVDCLCDYRVELDAAIKNYDYDRMVAAPKREIKAALDVKDSKCVLVRAGVAHIHTAREELKKAGVNYFIVAPKAAEQLVREKLKEGRKVHNGISDRKGHCERLEKSGRKPDVNWSFDK